MLLKKASGKAYVQIVLVKPSADVIILVLKINDLVSANFYI